MVLERFGYLPCPERACHPPWWDSSAVARPLVFAGDRSLVEYCRTVRRMPVSFLMALLSSFLMACGRVFIYRDTHHSARVLWYDGTRFRTRNPPLNYGTTRTWDSFPMLDWAEINSSAGVYEFKSWMPTSN